MRDAAKSVSVLFCCMGNICRSPTAEGVFRRRVAEAGLDTTAPDVASGRHQGWVGGGTREAGVTRLRPACFDA